MGRDHTTFIHTQVDGGLLRLELVIQQVTAAFRIFCVVTLELVRIDTLQIPNRLNRVRAGGFLSVNHQNTRVRRQLTTILNHAGMNVVYWVCQNPSTRSMCGCVNTHEIVIPGYA